MQTNFKKYNSRFATNADEDEVKIIQPKRFYKQPSKKAQGKCTSILFFADVHLVVGNLLKIKDFAQKHKKYIYDVVHLGTQLAMYTKEISHSGIIILMLLIL